MAARENYDAQLGHLGSPTRSQVSSRAGVKKGESRCPLGRWTWRPTFQMSACVGSAGRVIGIDLSEAMVAAARAHCRADNLFFEHGDITQRILLTDEVAAVVNGLLVLHNLHLETMGRV